MKLLILHLSDMHIKDHNGVNQFQIKKIVDVVASMGQYDRAIIIVSGDISFSGSADQYKYAEYVIGHIISQIKTQTNYNKHIDVICVPGNHDIDHRGHPRSSCDLQEIKYKNQYEGSILKEFQKQKAFFGFAKRNRCFSNNAAYERRILDYDGFKIEVNLLNSGIFSILEEDKGLHYLPKYCLNELTQPSGANLVFSVMHHAPDWFLDDQKNSIERTIYNKSAICFFGHEHYLGSKSLAFSKQQRALVQAGGCLCNNDDWDNSSFHIGLLDTETLNYSHGEYIWNCLQKQYESSPLIIDKLANKPSIEKKLQVQSGYRKQFIEDDKHNIISDFTQYYVFPRIQSIESIRENQKGFTNKEAFISEIKEKKRVIINGFDSLGKTALLKYLFLDFCDEGYVPLFCEIEDIKGKQPERIIKNCFEDIYGDDSSDYTRFCQLPIEKKVILIDDIDQIQTKYLDVFFAFLAENFGLCVFTSHETIDLSLIDRMKAQFNTGDSIPKYKIEPMYLDKREELLRKIVELKVIDATAYDRTVQALSSGISSQRQFFSLDPDFIINYAEFYINNIGEATSSDSNVFSKVFEANLTNAIYDHNKTKLSTDKVYILLSKVAYYIHFNKAYPITEKDLFSVVSDYNDKYGDTVNANDLIMIGVASKILVQDDSNGYRFVNKNYLAYFVAREVNREYHDTGDETKLKLLLQYACFGINSDVLLFITYITDNIRILRLLLAAIDEATKTWVEFCFDKDSLPDFLKGQFGVMLEAPTDETKEEERKAEITAEKESISNIQTTDLYDYSEDDAEKLVNQFIRATHLLSVAARCLPNFEHMMLKPDKDSFVKVIYSLPNKIFNIWAIETNKEVDSILEYFKKQSQEYFARKKPLSENEIKAVLQWSALSLLLELYNLSVLFSAKDTTMPLLNKFDYSQKSTYSIEHLMMLERQSSVSSFLDEADRITDEANNDIERTVVKRVVEHAMIKRNDFSRSLFDRAKNKYFPNKQSQQRIMAQRYALKKKGDE